MKITNMLINSFNTPYLPTTISTINTQPGIQKNVTINRSFHRVPDMQNIYPNSIKMQLTSLKI